MLFCQVSIFFKQLKNTNWGQVCKAIRRTLFCTLAALKHFHQMVQQHKFIHLKEPLTHLTKHLIQRNASVRHANHKYAKCRDVKQCAAKLFLLLRIFSFPFVVAVVTVNTKPPVSSKTKTGWKSHLSVITPMWQGKSATARVASPSYMRVRTHSSALILTSLG